MATVAAGLAAITLLATPAIALPPPGEDPPTPPDRPDLRVSALSVAPSGSNWSIAYTIANAGADSAAASTVTFNGGTGSTVQRAVGSIAAGATRSGSLQLPRTAECFIVMTASADSGRVVVEGNENNNARQVVSVVPPCPPRYRITAVSFTAADESGIDMSGSDEPFWIFNTVSNGGTSSSKASNVYGGIDTGDTQSFSLFDNCYWGCSSAGAPAPVGIGLSVQLWEQDLGDVPDILFDTAEAFQGAGPILTAAGASSWIGTATTAVGHVLEYILGWAQDDLLGTSTFAYSTDYLAGQLPVQGASFVDTRLFQGSDSNYSLTLVVRRIV
jgi:hypothetical protein